jgi:HEPN domain-containing protein
MRSARPSGKPTNRSGRPGSKLGLLGCGEGVTRISRRLRREGEPSMYGDEESGIPPDELYDKWDALEALRWARFTLRIVRRLFVALAGFDVRV